jgi:hypothetical protein
MNTLYNIFNYFNIYKLYYYFKYDQINKKEQYYRIKNQGLTKVKDDIYDVSEKADIIVKLSILF